jgi:prepilin-type N-terminal cleavage/methylation domain-containing protein
MKIQSSPRSGFTLVEIMIVVAIIGLLASIAVPNFVKSRLQAQKVACINNLRQIEGAKQLWALETKASATTIPATIDIQPFLGRGTAGTAPVCPADAAHTFTTSYDPGNLAASPRCLIVADTHLLP